MALPIHIQKVIPKVPITGHQTVVIIGLVIAPIGPEAIRTEVLPATIVEEVLLHLGVVQEVQEAAVVAAEVLPAAREKRLPKEEEVIKIT